MNLNAIDLDRLERLAREATPGEWYASPKFTWRGKTGSGRRTVCGSTIHASGGPCIAETRKGLDSVEQTQANAAYIAAVDPTTILSLIATLRELQNPRCDCGEPLLVRRGCKYCDNDE